MSERVAVSVGACRCEGKPHTEDFVYLNARVSPQMGMALNGAMRDAFIDPADLVSANSEMQALLTGVYLRYGIVGWDFLDPKGEPIPVTPGAIERLLTWNSGAQVVAEKADELYQEELWLPLAARLAEVQKSQPPKNGSSPDGQMEPLTSATHSNGRTPRAPSKLSSPSALVGNTSESG